LNPLVVLSAPACALHLIAIALAKLNPQRILEAIAHENFSERQNGAGIVDALILGRGKWKTNHLET
jgi:hypothetical protein